MKVKIAELEKLGKQALRKQGYDSKEIPVVLCMYAQRSRRVPALTATK